MNALLKANGVQPRILDVVERFIQPIIDRIESAEAMVIAFAKKPMPSEIGQLLTSDLRAVDTFNAVLMRLEAFSDEFSRMSNTTDQMRLSAAFRDFVAGMSAAFDSPLMGKDKPLLGKEPGKPEKDRYPER